MNRYPHTHAELAARLAIDPEAAAVLHAAGYDAGRSAPTGFVVPAFVAARALLDAVDGLPQHNGHPQGAADSDPTYELPELDPDSGLRLGTPPPPDGLPLTRALLWEHASDELRDQLHDDPTADGWTAYPPASLIRDRYGCDPRPWAAYAVQLWRTTREVEPYAEAVDALDRLAVLAQDTASRPDVATLSELIDRSAAGLLVPAGVPARLALLRNVEAWRVRTAVDTAVRLRTEWARDGYATGPRSAYDVSGDELASLAALLDRSVPPAPEPVELARRYVDV